MLILREKLGNLVQYGEYADRLRREADGEQVRELGHEEIADDEPPLAEQAIPT